MFDAGAESEGPACRSDSYHCNFVSWTTQFHTSLAPKSPVRLEKSLKGRTTGTIWWALFAGKRWPVLGLEMKSTVHVAISLRLSCKLATCKDFRVDNMTGRGAECSRAGITIDY